MQTDLKLTIIFLSFDMYFNGKSVEMIGRIKLYLLNCLMFSARPINSLPVY